MKLIGDEKVEADSLAIMRKRGGEWHAYQNHDLGHSLVGHLRFIKCGEGCTFKTPPERHPDTEDCIGWRYILVGKVNLETGTITE